MIHNNITFLITLHLYLEKFYNFFNLELKNRPFPLSKDHHMH